MKVDKKMQAKVRELQKKKALNNINRLEKDLMDSKNGSVVSKMVVPGWLCAMSVGFSIILGVSCSLIWQVYHP